MIEFHTITDFDLENPAVLESWINKIITLEGYELGEVSYIFCDDHYLHQLNLEFLQHDTLTDIISFDYRVGNQLNGEIYISVERVADNAKDFSVDFNAELHRVMIHGILHFCGYMDKSETDQTLMRQREDEAIAALVLME